MVIKGDLPLQNLNVKTNRLKTKSNKQDGIESCQYLNLPDLQFFQWCNQQFGVNRGGYNTVDQWLFEYGILNIHNRRIQLLAFLDFVNEEGIKQDQHKFLRFGNGGLKRRWDEFMNDSGKLGKIIPLKK